MIVEAVVFDLFHTIVDPERFRPREFSRLAVAAECFGVDADELERVWFDEVVDVVVRSPVRPVDMLAQAAARMGGLVTGPAVRAADDALGRFQDLALAEPLPGVIAVLDTLRAASIKTGLLSNAHERDVRGWPESPLAERFDAVVISCDAGVAKPDAAAYEAVVDLLDVAPGSALYCGDGNSGELSGARSAGFGLVIAVTGPALDSGFRTDTEMSEISRDAHMATRDVRSLTGLLGLR